MDLELETMIGKKANIFDNRNMNKKTMTFSLIKSILKVLTPITQFSSITIYLLGICRIYKRYLARQKLHN